VPFPDEWLTIQFAASIIIFNYNNKKSEDVANRPGLRSLV